MPGLFELVAVLVATLLPLAVALLAVWQLRWVCPPDEILVFSGRKRKLRDGSVHGFRIVTKGQAIQIPILESVDRLPRGPSVTSVETSIYSDDGIPLKIQVLAEYQLHREVEVMVNAVERFLGCSHQIPTVAEEYLSGVCRQVVASMASGDNKQLMELGDRIEEGARSEFEKIGLELMKVEVFQADETPRRSSASTC
ncbi:MAG: hypothetical protein HN348_15085 [Proteobacteria bacterium]|jgi:flotillin|nr:hypothetical protein [Pseudomonadota bacterium]